MKVDVTQEDIDNGKPKFSYCCAVALAVLREKPMKEVTVSTEYIEISDYGGFDTERYDLPAVARAFVEDFDEKLPVQPITFEAPLIPRYIKGA